MSRIVVQPNLLESIAARFAANAEEMDYLLNHLGIAIGGLDWLTLRAGGIEAQWGRAKSFGYELRREMGILSRYLTAKAGAFADADDAGAAGLEQVNAVNTAMRQQMTSWLQARPSFSFPQRTIENVSGLGDARRQIPIVRVDGLIRNPILGTRTLQHRIPSTWIEQLDDAANPDPSS